MVDTNWLETGLTACAVFSADCEYQFEIPGKPTPWQRAGRDGKRSFDKQKAKKRQIQNLARLAGVRVHDGPVVLKVLACFVPPKSWPDWRRRAAINEPHTSKPDGDNIAKLIKDALGGVAYRDDAQVSVVCVEKIYQAQPGVRVSIEASDLDVRTCAYDRWA